MYAQGPCFLVSLQCLHLLDLIQLALISIEKAQVVESIINVLVFSCNRSFNDEELYILFCIREQALL